MKELRIMVLVEVGDVGDDGDGGETFVAKGHKIARHRMVIAGISGPAVHAEAAYQASEMTRRIAKEITK